MQKKSRNKNNKKFINKEIITIKNQRIESIFAKRSNSPISLRVILNNAFGCRVLLLLLLGDPR